MLFLWSTLADPVQRRRLFKSLMVVLALLVAYGCVVAVGNARLGQQTDDLTADLRADLGAGAPPDDTSFPRAGDRMVGSWHATGAAAYWFEVRVLVSRRCIQVGLHDGGYSFDVYTPGERVCGSGPV